MALSLIKMASIDIRLYHLCMYSMIKYRTESEMLVEDNMNTMYMISFNCWTCILTVECNTHPLSCHLSYLATHSHNPFLRRLWPVNTNQFSLNTRTQLPAAVLIAARPQEIYIVIYVGR